MATKNYNKMSAQSKQEETKVVSEQKQSKPKRKQGKVVNCGRLNVRKDPNADAEVLTTIDSGFQVTVEECGDKAFYKVAFKQNGNTVNGYCMKDFIEIER